MPLLIERTGTNDGWGIFWICRFGNLNLYFFWPRPRWQVRVQRFNGDPDISVYLGFVGCDVMWFSGSIKAMLILWWYTGKTTL